MRATAPIAATIATENAAGITPTPAAANRDRRGRIQPEITPPGDDPRDATEVDTTNPPRGSTSTGGGGWGHGQHPPPARWDAGEDGYDRGGGFDARAPPRYDQGWQHQQPQSHAQYHQQQPPPQQQQQTYGAPAYQQQQHAYGDPYHQQPPSQQSYASQQHPGDGYGGATQQQYRY